MVSLTAMVARNRLACGVKLNHPEAIALITREQCMEGIPEMIENVQAEATFPDGTKLVIALCRCAATTTSPRPTPRWILTARRPMACA